MTQSFWPWKRWEIVYLKRLIGLLSYIGGDGRWYKVTYVADERGYRAKSEQLPWPLEPVISPLPPVHHSDITVKPAPAVVQTVIKNEEPAVVEMSKEKEPIKKLPATQITWNNTKSSVTVKDDNVLKEEQPTQPLVPEPTEKLAIHVPLFTKVYSLKSTKSQQTKHRKNKAGSQSPITRYKLSFLPAYGLVMHWHTVATQSLFH